MTIDTTPAIFARLVDTDVSAKAERLAVAISSLSSGTRDEIVFIKSLGSFAAVPGKPFSYWASQELLDAFEKFAPFESECRAVRQGLATADDFRFIRLWWEVDAGKLISGAQGNAAPTFRQQTFEGKYWVPIAKGGEYSPYYADLYLVCEWRNNGEMLKAFEPSVIRNEKYYFRSACTYALRTSRMCAWPLPAGSIISVRGSGIYAPDSELSSALAILNSVWFDTLIKLMLGRADHPQFDMGDINVTPVPADIFDNQDLKRLTEGICSEVRATFSADEELHSFRGCFSATSSSGASDGESQLLKIEELHQQVHQLIGNFYTPLVSEHLQDRDFIVTRGTENTHVSKVSLVFGVLMGRWDARITFDQSLAPELQGLFDPLPICSPATLVGPDGLPATSDRIASEAWLRARPNVNTIPPEGSVTGPATIQDEMYPFPIPWDGLLIDDLDEPNHADNIVARVQAVLKYLHGDEPERIEHELATGIGVRSLADYLRKPGGFFADHLTRYSKSRRQAPIYWPLSSGSGRLTVWIFYPRLTGDTLYRIDNRYLQPKLATVQRDIAAIGDRLSQLRGRDANDARELLAERSARRAELLEFQAELLRVANLPYSPDHDDGVILCAAPLWKLFRLPKWQKATQEAWEKLEQGDYDWARLAMAIWPERVIAKCRLDRSLAIAHGREGDYVAPPAAAGKSKKAKAVTRSFEDDEGEE